MDDLWLDDVCEHFVGLDAWGPAPDGWRNCLLCGFSKDAHDHNELIKLSDQDD